MGMVTFFLLPDWFVMKIKMHMYNINDNTGVPNVSIRNRRLLGIRWCMCVLGERGHGFKMLTGRNMIDLEVFSYKVRKLGYYIFSTLPSPHSHTCTQPPHPSSSLK